MRSVFLFLGFTVACGAESPNWEADIADEADGEQKASNRTLITSFMDRALVVAFGYNLEDLRVEESETTDCQKVVHFNKKTETKSIGLECTHTNTRLYHPLDEATEIVHQQITIWEIDPLAGDTALHTLVDHAYAYDINNKVPAANDYCQTHPTRQRHRSFYGPGPGSSHIDDTFKPCDLVDYERPF